MSESLDRDQLLKLTSKVVSAYVSSHRVAPAELEVIIGSVAGSLAEVGDPPQALPVRPHPAAPMRRSVGRNHLICLVCGKKQKMLKRHLAVRHQLTPDEYRFRLAIRVPNGCAELRSAAFRDGSADRVGAEPCRGSASPKDHGIEGRGFPEASHSWRERHVKGCSAA